MSGVFISYRRDDCAGQAGRLYDGLAEHFGEERVFRDIDSIQPGAVWGQRLEDAVGACGLLIALIGDDWLDAKDTQGLRRLDDPNDLVRFEIATGLKRSGLWVIPVLVEGARMPGSEELPDDLKQLAERQALELTESRWRYDMGRLVEIAERVTGPPAATPVDTPPSAPPGAAPAVAQQSTATLAQVLMGSWVVQVQSPLLGAGVLRISLSAANSQFQAAGVVGLLAGSQYNGQWEILPGEQLVLRGVRTVSQPFPQTYPYQGYLQFFSVTPSELHGITSDQERVVWRRE